MRRLFLLFGSASAIVSAIVSCDDDSRYVYTARRFDEANGCLEPYRPIERVEGEGVSVRCPEACLLVSGAIHVSPVCPPFPVNAEPVPAEDPACQAALDASRMEASCGAGEEEDGDGGEEDDGGEEEGGAEEDAESDAGLVLDAAEEG